jgi:myo-inositol-1(or 4)-monophosphatase
MTEPGNPLYQQVIDHMLSSGRRIRDRAGRIDDIGVTKAYLTEEDIRIERELAAIVHAAHPDHHVYAEEEHDHLLDAEDVWVVDPISGTQLFISGLPHYAIVAAHVHGGRVQFAAVFDPTLDDLYTAHRGQGAYLNGRKFSIGDRRSPAQKIVFNLSIGWPDTAAAARMFGALGSFDLYRIPASHAANDCLVARGSYSGVVTFGKDSFPYFASSLIVKEAGGVFTNLRGEEDIRPNDRVFIGGDLQTYQMLKPIVERVIGG